jgi:hypothetical protein
MANAISATTPLTRLLADRHPIVKGLEQYPEVLRITREVGAVTDFG